MFNSEESTNPIAFSIPLRGINLPSGHERTEEEIDYICSHIRELLGKETGKCSALQPHGLLAYKDTVENRLSEIKKSPEFTIELKQGNNLIGYLKPVTATSINSAKDIQLLSDWRDNAQDSFPAQFKVTNEGTTRWLEKALLDVKDRILFWVLDKDQNKIGHVGLFRFDYPNKFCELDNIMRGVPKNSPGIIEASCAALIDFCKQDLKIQDIYLRVFSNNPRAISLYERLGFKETQRSPLRKVVENGVTKWIDVIKSPYEKIERYFVTMHLDK